MSWPVGVYKIDYEKQEEVLIGHFDDHAFIGQSKNSDIIVKGPKISGIHALLERKNNEYHLTDLGSQYGTFKKNKRIKDIRIAEWEPFQLGRQVLFLKDIDDKDVLKRFKIQKKYVPEPTPEIIEPNKKIAPNTAAQILQVSLFWGEKTIEVRNFEENSIITLGTQPNATFLVAFGHNRSQNNPYPIARFDKGSLSLSLPVDASGIIWMDDQIYSIDSLRHRDSQSEEFGQIEVKLNLKGKAHIHFGELSLSFRFVIPAKPIPVNWFAELDETMVKITLTIAIFLLFLFLYLQFTPRTPEPVKTLADMPKNLQRILFDSGINKATKKEQASIGQLAANLEAGREDEEVGRSAGATNASSTNASVNLIPSLPKQERTIGVSKKSGTTSNKKTNLDIDSVFATNTKSPLVKDKNLPIYGPGTSGNMVSKLVGENYGKGSKNVGTGGGGTSVGIGQLKGNSTGGKMGHGDTGLIPIKGHEINSNVAGAGGSEIKVVGGLDSDIIASIVKRYLPQIQNCYEQQLVNNPSLKGKIVVAFTIGPDGNVKNPTISESSLRNQPIEKCILAKIQEWKFPRPRGGGTVGVKYPFLLMSSKAH